MFAVPGWNITAPLKAQTESPAEKRGKKRKREQKPVGKEDIDQFWSGKDNATDNDALAESKDGDGGNQTAPEEGVPRKEGETGRKRNKKNKEKKSRENLELDSAGDSESLNLDATATKKSEPAAGKGTAGVVAQAAKTLTPVSTSLQTAPATKLTPLQAAMHQKLASARFRHLNQTLYTTGSGASLELFTQNPDMFHDYHMGFAQQVAVWPENPVDRFVSDVLHRGKLGLERYAKKEKYGKKDKRKHDLERAQKADWEANGIGPLPRNFQSGLCTIADLGCGTASFSDRLQQHTAKPPKGLGLKIHSFDLHASSLLVRVADISNLPLSEGSVDVAVFCLALMGTNWVEFVDEAWRILRWKGECWISEIKSRFGRVGNENKVVGHSIGSHNKKKDKKGKKGKKDPDEEEDAPQNHPHSRLGYVNDEIDDPDSHAKQLEQTDIAAFVEVMRRHGFALENEADMSNKMFVKMVFIKAVKPVKGKNVRKDENETRAPRGGKRFLATEDEDDLESMTVEDEGKVLKPCVYKLR